MPSLHSGGSLIVFGVPVGLPESLRSWRSSRQLLSVRRFRRIGITNLQNRRLRVKALPLTCQFRVLQLWSSAWGSSAPCGWRWRWLGCRAE
ncbi:hypothetical protein SZ55_5177 [Pseudomonas sp. FeS53a]|nr:hypothetical protein SZ55_5177 [Pseudomonas sp. FeS53a]